MRILLAANASYIPPRGGATRSNLLWLEHLAGRGHECRIVAAGLAGPDAAKRRQIESEEIHRRWSIEDAGHCEVARREGITVFSIAERRRMTAVFREQISEFQPDWVLISSEDLGHALLREAHRSAPGRVVYLAHTPQFFPFGPASWNPEPDGAQLVARSAGVVAICRHMAGYVREHARCEAAVIHPPVYGSGPFANLACFGQGLVTIINPCAVKGISIFLALADRFPQHSFGALPGWGTTGADREKLEKRPNVVILPNCRDIEQVLSRTRVLLMPSLWYEGFGLSAMEAMLRGIPVISSDTGGLREAKAGTRFIIPVRGIERFEAVFDDRGMPKPVVPEPDIEPWARALDALLTDRALYEEESRISRRAALGFVSGLRAGAFEDFLLSLRPGEAAKPAEAPAPSALSELSDEKRALLLKLLRRKADERKES